MEKDTSLIMGAPDKETESREAEITGMFERWIRERDRIGRVGRSIHYSMSKQEYGDT